MLVQRSRHVDRHAIAAARHNLAAGVPSVDTHDLRNICHVRGDALPTIAYFLGISVRMFFNDHDPPHVHVRYQGFRARVLISNGEIIGGKLPPTAARVMREWTALRQDALMRNWRAARSDAPLEQIEGLE